MTPEELKQVDELFERSKDDRAIIVGSEVRWLCGLVRRSLLHALLFGPASQTTTEVRAQRLLRYAEEMKEHAWLSRFRKGNNSLSGMACQDIASYVDMLIQRIAEFFSSRDEDLTKLQKFKAWVHNYLDLRGVPYHPPGVHGEHGCRIGDRLDWLMKQMEELKNERDTARQVLADTRALWPIHKPEQGEEPQWIKELRARAEAIPVPTTVAPPGTT